MRLPRVSLRRPSTAQPPPEQKPHHAHMGPLRKAWATLAHHLKRHVGVGIICAVAYFDPGNWSVDLQAGSQFGYKLLFVVLVAGIGAVILQTLACKLGCVTGRDLAAHCRILLHDHPRHPKLVRRVFLYPLYVLSELAIISTDLAELLGSAIGIVLIFPSIPLPIAVLLTATDVIFILAVGDPARGHGKPVRLFEIIIIILVLVVFISFIVLIVKVSPVWPEVFKGYLPSRSLVTPSGLYAAIGIVGATVMPHALYLGSYLATQDRVSNASVTAPLALPAPAPVPLTRHATFKKVMRMLFAVGRVNHGDGEIMIDTMTPYGERLNNTLAFVKAHLKHGIWDIVMSLMGFAVAINSAILILAGAVFFFGPGRTADGQSAGLFDAHDLIRDLIGKPAAFIFALALLCSGQSASITATLAGQIVSEGFIEWRISPFLRRIITRLIGLIPAMVVASAVGRSGIDTLLVISQVILSIVLPFVMFPLVWLTSSTVVMRVHRPHEVVSVECEQIKVVGDVEAKKGGDANQGSVSAIEELDFVDEVCSAALDVGKAKEVAEILDVEEIKGKGKAGDIAHLESTDFSAGTDHGRIKDEDNFVDYSNGWPLTIVAYGIWLLVLIANGYLIVTLAID